MNTDFESLPCIIWHRNIGKYEVLIEYIYNHISSCDTFCDKKLSCYLYTEVEKELRR